MGIFATLGAKLTADSRDLDRGLSRAEDKLKKTKGEIDNTSKSTKKLSKASGQAQGVLFAFSQGAQDAAFSLVGATNNIEPMIGQFQQLRKTTGSTGKAFGALFSQVASIGGAATIAVTAATLIIQNWDKVKGVFGGVKDSIADLKEEYKDLVEDVTSFDEEAILPEGVNIDSGLEAKEYKKFLNQRIQAFQTQLGREGFEGGIGAEGMLGELAAKQQEVTRLTQQGRMKAAEAAQAEVDALKDRIRLKRQDIALLQTQLESADKLIEKYNAQTRTVTLTQPFENQSGRTNVGGGGGQSIPESPVTPLVEAKDEILDLNGALAGVAYSGEQVVSRLGAALPLTEQNKQKTKAWNAEFTGVGKMAMNTGHAISKTIVGGLTDSITQAKSLKDVLGGVGRQLLGVLTKLGSTALTAGVGSLIPGAGSFGSIFKGILGFAEGGIVTRPTLGLIGEAGESEAVIPLSKLKSMMGAGAQRVPYILRVSADTEELAFALEQARSTAAV